MARSPARAAQRIALPTRDVRRYLEPGPIVLVTSAWKGRSNVMTMGWHTVMGFSPSLVGCVISRANHSHAMVRKSGECAINIPEARWVDEVVGIGNCSGAEVPDKFARFGLTVEPARSIAAPLVKECFAQLECRVVDTRLVAKYDFFILEVLHAWIAPRPRAPHTLHYQGDGQFVVSGKAISRRSMFAPHML